MSSSRNGSLTGILACITALIRRSRRTACRAASFSAVERASRWPTGIIPRVPRDERDGRASGPARKPLWLTALGEQPQHRLTARTCIRIGPRLRGDVYQ